MPSGCGTHPNAIDFLTNFSGEAAFDAVYCAHVNLVGEVVFTLFIIATFGGMHVIHDGGNPVNVIVLMILLGGIFVATAPSNILGMLIVGTIITIAGIIVYGILSVRPS